jgi:secreted trypsin-like serine protease
MPRYTLNLLILALSLIFLSTTATAQKTPKIIGGTTTDAIEWPWMSRLVNSRNSSLLCGASLIAKEWALTAGHCVFMRNKSDLDIIINQAIIGSGSGEKISVERIIIHPLYNDNTLDNDLALLKLSRASSHSPVKLISPYSFQDDAEKLGRALGWGTLSFPEENFPTDLREVDLSILSNSECATTMSGVTENMLCAGFGLGKKDTCSGDSGGPLIVFDNESDTWNQVAITSWGSVAGCSQPDTFGVYTRLEKYASFISENICTSSEIPSPVSLSLQISDKTVTASWNKSSRAKGYRLYYAPYPHLQTIYSIDINDVRKYSATLSLGSAFFVAILAYNGNCLSDFSNIEDFIIS